MAGPRHQAQPAHIALKLLPPELTADPERRRRFVREARTAAAVTHPNIVTIYEIVEVDGVRFIAMELVEGRLLRTVIGAMRLQFRRRCGDIREQNPVDVARQRTQPPNSAGWMEN